MQAYLRRSLLFSIPICVGILGIIHPIVDINRAYSDLLPRANLWIVVHILQLPLFFLLSLIIYLLISNTQTRMAFICKLALVSFALFYPASDSITGIGGGLLVHSIAELPSDQQVMFAKVVSTFFDNPLPMIMGSIGALSWEIAIIGTAIILCRPHSPRWMASVVGITIFLFGFSSQFGIVPSFIWWPAMLVLAIAFGFTVEQPLPGCLMIIAALSFGQAHVLPYGPLGMLCLLLAILYFDLFNQKAERQIKLREPDKAIDLP